MFCSSRVFLSCSRQYGVTEESSKVSAYRVHGVHTGGAVQLLSPLCRAEEGQRQENPLSQ